MGQLRKRQMNPPARPVDSGMAKPQTWRSQLLPDTDADWTWMFHINYITHKDESSKEHLSRRSRQRTWFDRCLRQRRHRRAMERREEQKRTANDRCGAPGYGIVGFLPQSSSLMQRNVGSEGETIHRITRYPHTCAHSSRGVDGLNYP